MYDRGEYIYKYIYIYAHTDIEVFFWLGDKLVYGGGDRGEAMRNMVGFGGYLRTVK